MKSVKVKSYAKINLCLEITGVKDGYHQLDSLVASLDFSDTVVAKSRKDDLVNVIMHGQGSESIPPEKNIACRAGDMFVQKFKTHGADITIFKDIPMGGGVGGSSADAAGVLNAMAKLYDVQDKEALKALADELGSDTGYMLTGGFARMRGRGEDLTFLPIHPTLSILLLCPHTPVSTGECYSLFDDLPKGEHPHTEQTIQFLKEGKMEQFGKSLYNDLYLPATKLNNEVEQALNDLAAFSPIGYGMTGSGSCVFAIFENREFCEYAKSRYKGKCRAIVTKTITPSEQKAFSLSRLRSPFYLSQEEIDEAKQ